MRQKYTYSNHILQIQISQVHHPGVTLLNHAITFIVLLYIGVRYAIAFILI